LNKKINISKILIYNSGGGLGDSIQIIPLILSLKNHYRKSKLFYLGAHPNHFDGKLKEYNIKIETLDLDLKYFGFRWWHLLFVKKNYKKKNEKKFDLIIDLQSKFRNSLMLKRIPHEHFYSKTFGNFFSTQNIKYNSKNHLENLNIFLNEKIKLLDFNYTKLSSILLKEAQRLLPKTNYIGFSITQGNEYRKKSWSIYKFIALANKCLIKNKIPVFFIEKNQELIIEKIKSQVPSAIFPELSSKLSCPALVTALASRLDQAVSIDNGVMHMMGLANISMIVLFGPTSSEKFAPENNYTKILDSKRMYNTSNIESITVNDVYDLI
jgi:ADP-heptose:LPS heptosyltransferase